MSNGVKKRTRGRVTQTNKCVKAPQTCARVTAGWSHRLRWNDTRRARVLLRDESYEDRNTFTLPNCMRAEWHRFIPGADGPCRVRDCQIGVLQFTADPTGTARRG